MGVPGGRTVPQVVQNVDPCPTLLEHMAATPATPVDGRSVGPLLHPAEDPTEWRTVALVEHQGPNRNPDDPDYAVPSLGGLGQDPAQLCLGRPAGSLAARTTPAGLSLDGKVDLRDLGGAANWSGQAVTGITDIRRRREWRWQEKPPGSRSHRDRLRRLCARVLGRFGR